MIRPPEMPLISPAEPALDNSCQQVSAALRPSEYTAALIQVLRARGAWVRGANALEIGSGSGVVLRGAWGARRRLAMRHRHRERGRRVQYAAAARAGTWRKCADASRRYVAAGR